MRGFGLGTGAPIFRLDGTLVGMLTILAPGRKFRLAHVLTRNGLAIQVAYGSGSARVETGTA